MYDKKNPKKQLSLHPPTKKPNNKTREKEVGQQENKLNSILTIIKDTGFNCRKLGV